MTEHPRESLDLDDASRRAIEFDELLSWVASFARTTLGVERILSLTPSADVETVHRRLAGVEEIRRCQAEGGALVPPRLPDPREAIDVLGVEGVRLEGKSARDLARAIEATRAIRARLGGLPEESFPQLRGLAEALPDLRAESEAVLSGTDAEGRLLDDASPELRRLRQHAARTGDRLRRLLQRFVRDPQAEAVIRDDFVTQRNGRFVIPVRTDAPRPVRGIVHASSSSGATQFVEPLESVDLNNALVRLVEDEREERERILSAWSDALRARLGEVETAVDVLARADALQARGLWADACGAVTPRIEPAAALRLGELRHPLLYRRLRDEGSVCVPATFELSPADQVLVLSGPNTGGKTVALKNVGLAVVMAQSGIPLAARSAELPLYRQVRVDIGDHQSIEADLSTYSAHVRAVSESIRNPEPPALLLFDEIGTGTEPTEGAALARAILESLVRPGITTLATTHLGPVKAWAVTASGAVCASMDFDPETLVPSYRIIMGAAGRSGGLEIAERLGLSDTVVDRARSLLDPQVRESEGYLRRLREALAEAEARAEEVRRRQQELEQERRREEERREREDEARGHEADRALTRALGEFRRRADREIAGLQDPVAREGAERRRTRAERRMQSAASRARAGLVRPEGERKPARGPVDVKGLAAGDRVWVSRLDREGIVEEVEGDVVAVRLGGVVCRESASDLCLPPEGGRAEGVGPSLGGAHFSSRVCAREVMLIGRRVDEALEELDRFLDAAQLAGHDEIRVVHGHGTGRLRAAVREFLKDHAQVRGHRAGRGHEGGDGATVVRLR